MNTLKKIINLFTIAIIIYSINSFAALTIAEARAIGDNVPVEIGPVFISTTNDFAGSWYNIFAQDASGGIQLAGPLPVIPNLIADNNLIPGSCVTLSGTNGTYANAYQITYISVVQNYGNSNLPAATLIDIDTLATLAPAPALASLEGKLIAISGVDFLSSGTFSGGTTYSISKNGTNGNIRIQDANDSLVGSAIPNGSDIVVTGIFAVYNSNYQIYPLSVIGPTRDPYLWYEPYLYFNFGEVYTNYDRTMQISVRNGGEFSNLNVSAFSAVSGDTTKFSPTSIPDFSLPPQTTTNLFFTYSPGNIPGTSHSAVYQFQTDDISNQNNSVTFIGNASATPLPSPAVWINEVAANDPSFDDQEFIEICGVAGTDISGWKIQLYNGYDGINYAEHVIGSTIGDSFVFADEQDGFGFYVLQSNNSSVSNADETANFDYIQHSINDAVRLTKGDGTEIHFFAYQCNSARTYTPGLPNDLTILYDTPAQNNSLSKVGNGIDQPDFLWDVVTHTPGGLNSNQFLHVNPLPPDYVSATDGTFPDKVQVNWSENTNATKYKVYRNTIDSSSSAIDISSDLSSTNFDDTTAAQGQLYFYWVKAGNSNGWSNFSTSDSGMKLSAPDLLTASDGTFTNKVEITWSESIGATKFMVYRSLTDNSAASAGISGEISATNYNDTTATQGQLYYYWVKAGNSNGWSDLGASESGYKNINPPENVNATDGIYPDKIYVGWGKITNATKYKVYRNTTDNSSAASDISGDIFVTNFNDTTASSGQLYFYWVKAGNANGYSDFSTSNSGMKLSSPDILNVSDGTFTNKVEITWNESIGATKFLVYHSATDNTSTAINISGEITNTNYNDTATSPGQIYYYWIKSGNTNGWSDFGASESGYKGWSTPSNVSATDGVYPDKIRVGWSGVDGADKYMVYRNQIDNSSTAADISSEISATSFDDTNAEQNQLYYYWIKAGNSSGWSDFSASDSGSLYVLPIADIIFPNAPTSGVLPFAINFVGEGTAGGSAITNYQWNFGDATFVTNGVFLTNVIHTFSYEGVYTSQFTVTDAENYTNSDFVVTTVIPEPFGLLIFNFGFWFVLLRVKDF